MGKVRQSAHSCFYVLFSAVREQLKVGVTNDFDGRYRALCNANGENLRQVIVVECPFADQLEAVVHGILFNRWVQRGEWFRYNENDFRVVYEMIRGLFLTEHCLDVHTKKGGFSYWQNSLLLTMWTIPNQGPEFINCTTATVT